MDKKGVSPNILLIFFIFFFFFATIFLGIWIFGITQVESAFSSIDLTLGDVNFNETYNDGLFPAFESIKNSADNLGLLLLFGMILMMVIIAFFVKGSRMLIVYDIALIVVSFALSVQMSIAFNDYRTAVSEINAVHVDILPKTSAFLLNLPYLIVIIGVLVGIITYGLTRKKSTQPKVFGEF